MIGLDTNVLVRYIMQDDTKQSPKATKIIDSLTVDESTAATRSPLPVRTSITPFAASARTATML